MQVPGAMIHPFRRASRAAALAMLCTVLSPAFTGCGDREPPGIRYHPTSNLELDVHSARTPGGPRPAVLLLHGSCFDPGGSRHAMDAHAAYLAERGFVAVVVGYRLGAQGRYPNAVRDVKCAVRWVKSNATAHGIDPDRIALLGASAGGFLASFASATTGLPEFDEPACGDANVDDSVAAVVALYAVSDLETRCRRGQIRKCEEHFLQARCDPSTPDARFREASVIRYADRIAVPFLLLHGAEDDDIQVEQSEILASRLKRRGADVTFRRYERAGHGFDIEWGTPASVHALREIVEFLSSRLAAPSATVSERG